VALSLTWKVQSFSYEIVTKSPRTTLWVRSTAGGAAPAAAGNFLPEMASVASAKSATYKTNIAISGTLRRAISGRFCRAMGGTVRRGGTFGERFRPALGATTIQTSRQPEPGSATWSERLGF
jgi:hypothetical protein